MADRVLPSRETVAIDLALAEVDLSDAPLRDILTIAQHWASGRLVDREAIDYEAGIEAWWQVFGVDGRYNSATRAAIDVAIGEGSA